MNEFLASVRGDLLDSRRRPILIALVLVLVAALVYAAMGGSSSSPSTPAPAPVSPPRISGIAVTAAPSGASQAVAETTSGAAQQRHGSSRNPFTPLPGAAAASTPSSSASGASSTKTSTSTSGASESSSSSSEKSSGTSPKSTGKSKTVYAVAVRFGVAPVGTPTEAAQLTGYENLERQRPLPSRKHPLIVFRGVTAGGKSATFTLVGEAILRGRGHCLPSPEDCAAFDLRPGQVEELEYLPPGAAAITYQLQLVSITSKKASAARARVASHRQSKAGLLLLRRLGLTALPGLHYVPESGVLVFAAHAATAPPAHG